MRPAAVSLLLSFLFSAPCLAKPVYRQTAAVPLGAPDRWDYAVYDPESARLYVAHSDRLDVIDGASAAVVGSVSGIPGGTHGTAIVHSAGRGFTDDGRNGVAVSFDLRTLKVIGTIPADKDADAVAYEARSGHVFVIEGDPGAITVVDPNTGRGVATIKAGEKMEYAVPGEGVLYVAGEEKRDLLAVDTRTNSIRARWPTPQCESPHGLAFDSRHQRLFMSCTNAKLVVVNAKDGHVVAMLPIGRGSDAAAYDPSHGRVFSSNGVDGTISVYQQIDADHYRALDLLATKVSGRTMAVDPRSGRLFVVAADTDVPASPGTRPKPRPGTLSVLVFDPAA